MKFALQLSTAWLLLITSPVLAQQMQGSGFNATQEEMRGKVAAGDTDKPWPRSECTNGWVDRMTGKCPDASFGTFKPRTSKKSKHDEWCANNPRDCMRFKQ
jgi:hypothetical protein